MNSVSEDLLEDINIKANLLLNSVQKYLLYKVCTATKETCGEFARETEYQKRLFDVLTEYTEREKMKQDLFDILHKEASKFKENENDGL